MGKFRAFFPEHFSKADYIGILSGFAISLIAFYALINVKLQNKTNTKIAIAHIEKFSNNVRYKDSGSVSFFEVTKNEVLQNKDEIFTGENSNATVRFVNSNNLIKIPSSSLVKIEEGTQGETIEIKDGVIDIVMAKDQAINLKVNGVEHQIIANQTPNTIKAYFSAGELHLISKNSAIKVKSEKAEFKVKENSDAVFKGEEVVKATGFNLLTPGPGDTFNEASNIKVTTNLKAKYDITISKNADFSNNIHSGNYEGNSFNISPLSEEGEYYLKVSDSKNTRIVPISYAFKYKIEDIHPANGEQITIAPLEKITLRWKKLAVPSYKITYKNHTEKEITSIVTNNELIIDNLKGPLLNWKVSPEINHNKYSHIIQNNEVKINYSGSVELLDPPQKNNFVQNSEPIKLNWKTIPDEIYKLKFLDLINNKILSEKYLKNGPYILPTNSRGHFKAEISAIDYPGLGKAEYQYEVASPILIWNPELPKEFKSSDENLEIYIKYKERLNLINVSNLNIKYTPIKGQLIEKNIPLGNFNKIKLIGFGHYCFSGKLIKPIDMYIDSDDYCFNLNFIPPFEALPKAKDTILKLQKSAEGKTYLATVPAITKAKTYQFEIYSDKLATNLIFNTTSQSPSFSWKTERAGIFYLKYKVFDDKNRASEYSPVSKIIFPISPLSKWVPE
jgi:hypothetical protein